MLIAKEGELVTCENGHPICTVAEDIHTETVVDRSQFRDWTWDYSPEYATPIPPCPQCGKLFIRTNLWFGNDLHVGNEWRGPTENRSPVPT